MFRAYIDNPLCQQILLGCCHDRGYVPFLREWQAPLPVSKRITLIQGGDITPEMRSLGFEKTTDIDCVFSPESDLAFVTTSPLEAIPPQIPANSHTATVEAESLVSTPNRLGPIKRNQSGKRIDREIHVNAKLLETMKPASLCSWYYLRGECTGKCGKNHSFPMPLKDDEFNVVWWLARQGQCYTVKKGKDCDDDKCVYRHHAM